MSNVGYATLQVIPSMRGVSDELRQQLVQPAGDAGERAGKAAGSGLKDKIRAGAAAAGVVAGAVLVTGITDALGRMDAGNLLQAQLGTTGPVAERHGRLAGELYAEGVTATFEDAAAAIRAVVQSGLAPPDATNAQLEEIATKASDVATVFEQDLGGVTNAVSQMLRTGLAGSADEAFDLLSAGFQDGVDKGEDFLDTINEYGVQFQKAGLDGATAIGLLNQAIDAGAPSADKAADAIKEFSIRAVDGSDLTQEGFEALGLSASEMAAQFGEGGASASAALDTTLDRLRDIEDPVKQAEIATALFGTQAEDLGAALFAMDPSTAAQELGEFGGAAEQVGETIRTGPSHELEVFKRGLQGELVTALGNAATWFNQADPAAQKFALGLAAVAVAAGPLSFVASGITRVGGAAVGAVAGTARFTGGLIRGSAALGENASRAARAGAAVRTFGGAVGRGVSGTAGLIRTLALVGTEYTKIGVKAGLARARILAVSAAQKLAAAGSFLKTLALVAVEYTKIAVRAVAARAAILGQAIVQRAIAVATGIWTAAQWALNLAMSANPLGLIVIAIIAVIAAIVLLWRNSETFRSIVTGAFNAVWSAIKFVWSWVKSNWPLLLAIITGPIGIAIGLVIRYWDQIKAATLAAWQWVKSSIGAVVDWLVWLFLNFTPVGLIIQHWDKLKAATAAAWRWLRITVSALWRGLVNWVVSRTLSLRDRVVGAVTGLRDRSVALVAKARDWVVARATELRDRTVARVAGLRDRAVAVLTALRDRGVAIASALRDWVVARAQQLRDRVVGAADTLRSKVISAFERARDGVDKAWSKLQDVAKAPVRFLIQTVYNRGIVGLWNKVAAKVPGINELSEMNLPRGFRKGGILPGYSTWRQGDDQFIRARKGEGIAISEAMRVPALRSELLMWNAVGVRGGVGALRRYAQDRRARVVTSPRAIAAGQPPIDGFAVGGIVGEWIGSAWDSIVGKLKDWATAPLNRLRDRMKDRYGGGQDFPGIPYRMVVGIREKILSRLGRADSDYAASMAGGADDWVGLASASARLRRAARFARSQHGDPYVWGGAGPHGFDCSGLTGSVENRIRGVGPYFRRYSTHAFQGNSAPPGWVRGLRSPYEVGITHSGVGHTAGTLMGVHIESRGGRGVIVGRGARGANDRLFSTRYGFRPVVGDSTAGGGNSFFYDSGGYAQPGVTSLINGTRRPEPVLTHRQWSDISTLAGRGAERSGDTYNLYPRTLDMTVHDLEVLQRRQEARARVRRPR
ncbi:phage tail tape measure protein [Nocardiopsis sp. NPDC049922]|uniref:phage tail tape measure protein n=1 Tax=Nocardiopsis sp. NPDC049922 TaxID=3155157 RepID=UPI0033FF85C5